jgi:glycosyltransferase involved in cell wall biosynthesis
MYHADLLGGLAAFFAGKRNVIWGIRTTDVQAGGTRSTMLVRHVCAWLSRFIPHTIVCAAEASRVAHVAAGYCAAKMKVVPNGFDLPKLTASPDQRALLRSHCGFADSTLVVGTLGRFNPAKDHHCFVQAAGIVAKIYPHVCFLMVGRGLDSSNEELKTWISQTGYAERFMLLGERADVPVCLAAMDLFCLSSRTEGFPNVVGEAMAMERSCIVTNVGDAAMLVADTGLVVPREDPLALALGLGEFIAAPSSVRFDLGRRAKGRIYAEFSIDRARDRFESIYNSILRNKEGRD